MAQEKNKRIKSSDKQNAFTPEAPNVPNGFQCSWPTFWTAIGVILTVIAATFAGLNYVIAHRIAPLQNEIEANKKAVDVIQEQVWRNEHNRDEKIALQLQIIEQKINIYANSCGKK